MIEIKNRRKGFAKTPAFRVFLVVLIACVVAALTVLAIRWFHINSIYKQIRDNTNNKDRFEEMIRKNPDVIAWLSVKGTKIDTVVVQGKDNLEYINLDVFRNESFAGTPFLDYRNDKHFEDKYSIIYGHLMEDHLMFGDLELFEKQEAWKKPVEGSLELKDGTVLDISFFAFLRTKSDNNCFFDPRYVKNNWSDSFLADMLNQTDICTDTLSLEDSILVLSTCEKAGSDERLLLLGKLTQREQ